MKFHISVKGKTKEEKMKYLNSLEYRAVLKKAGKKFYLFIPELSIVAVNQEIEQAYKELNDQKMVYFENMLQSGSDADIVYPESKSQSLQTFHQLKVFAYKLLILGLLFGVVFILSSVVLLNKVSNMADSGIATGVAKKAAMGVEKFTNVSEEKEKKRLLKVRHFFEALKPYSDVYNDVFGVQKNKRR